MPPPIRIIPLLPVSVELISSIIHPLHSVFQTEIILEEPLPGLVEKVYDDSRAQYNSTDIIRKLLDREELLIRKSFSNTFAPDPKSKIVGITSVDLFVPILTYVFGEAQLDGQASVVSTFRLDNSIYGLEPDPVLLFERTLKETVHELGHTFGLYHCQNLECAMHASTAVEDIDIKGGMLCNECRKKAGVDR
ncbi:MAG: archaemetzincin family Zn-dependent metalloprotease [Bacteroidota bacterium]|jgi:archaemetzincin